MFSPVGWRCALGTETIARVPGQSQFVTFCSCRRRSHPAGKHLFSRGSGPLKPKYGLNGPPAGVALRSDLAHDDHRNSNFLFPLRQLRNNFSNFIEYLVPALHLTAVFRALHGFISNEGEFRPAVSEILKDGDVVRTVDRLMFYA
jgi:hypothetical protein